MLFDVDVELVLDIDLLDLIMNDEMIDLNLLNVLEKDYLYYLMKDDNEDIEDMDEYLIKVIHV